MEKVLKRVFGSTSKWSSTPKLEANTSADPPKSQSNKRDSAQVAPKAIPTAFPTRTVVEGHVVPLNDLPAARPAISSPSEEPRDRDGQTHSSALTS
jgi:hypothetical protein